MWSFRCETQDMASVPNFCLGSLNVFFCVGKNRLRELSGTGLVISIVRHLVQLFGGGVDVENKVGEGTVFTVRLLLVQRQAGF